MKTEAQQHWAGENTNTIIAAATDRRQAHDTYARRSATIRALVQSEGAEWVKRFIAELDAAVEAVNSSIGRQIIDRNQGDDGAVNLFARERGGSYLLIVPQLGLDAPYSPGLEIRVQLPDGRRFVTPYDFAVEGTRLRLLVDGLDRDPAAAARAIAEGWFRAVVAAHYN